MKKIVCLSAFILLFAAIGTQNVTGQSTIIEQSIELRQDRGHIRYAVFSPDGQTILTMSDEANTGSLPRIWDAHSGRMLRTLEVPRDSRISSIAFTADGSQIIGRRDAEISRFRNYQVNESFQVWDTHSGRGLQTLNTRSLLALFGRSSGTNLSFVVSQDGNRIAMVSRDATDRLRNELVRIWDVESGRELRILKGFTDWVDFATFSPDGGKIATRDSNITRIWDVNSGQELHNLGGVRFVAFSPDGKKMITEHDRVLQIWDTDSGQVLQDLQWEGQGGLVHGVAFSPDGKRMFARSGEGFNQRSHVWDMESGREVLRGGVTRFVFSPDGKKIALGGGTNALIVRADSGAKLQELTGHFRDISSVAFSSDGKKIVTASNDTSARIWDAESGQELQRLLHTGAVHSATFSPDGKKVLTVGDVGGGNLTRIARIWTLDSDATVATHDPTVEVMGQLTLQPSPVPAVAPTPTPQPNTGNRRPLDDRPVLREILRRVL